MGGFGLAGLSRRILVWPASIIWPVNLVITTNLNTLHAGNDPSSPGMSRFKFFMIALVATFVYHFFPGELLHDHALLAREFKPKFVVLPRLHHDLFVFLLLGVLDQTRYALLLLPLSVRG